MADVYIFKHLEFNKGGIEKDDFTVNNRAGG